MYRLNMKVEMCLDLHLDLRVDSLFFWSTEATDSVIVLEIAGEHLRERDRGMPDCVGTPLRDWRGWFASLRRSAPHQPGLVHRFWCVETTDISIVAVTIPASRAVVLGFEPFPLVRIRKACKGRDFRVGCGRFDHRVERGRRPCLQVAAAEQVHRVPASDGVVKTVAVANGGTPRGCVRTGCACRWLDPTSPCKREIALWVVVDEISE